MNASEAQLTAALIQDIATRLKAGAFERVAVESLGIAWEVYQNWLRQTELPDSPREYALLAAAVREAKAFARLHAEMQVREKDAKAWLLYGPGRQTPTQEGWGAADKAAGGAPDTAVQISELCALLLEALAPFPDARAAAAEKLTQREKR